MILTIANQKGGVAKTTTAVTLAHGLALRERRVLLIDLDPQGNASSALGLDPAGDLYHWLTNGSGKITPARPYLDLIRSDKSSANLEYVLQSRRFAEYALSDRLDGHGWDYVIIDCAPSIDVLQIAAIMAADLMLIPTTMTQLSLEGMTQVVATLAQLQCRGSHCHITGILPTRYERAKRDQVEQLLNLAASDFGQRLWAPVPTDANVDRSHRAGQTLYEYAPRCRALVGGYIPAVDRLVEVGG